MIDFVIFIGSWLLIATLIWGLAVVILKSILKGAGEDVKSVIETVRNFIWKRYWVIMIVVVIFALFNSNRFLPTSSSVDQQVNYELEAQLEEVDTQEEFVITNIPKHTLETKLEESWEEKTEQNRKDNEEAKKRFLEL